MLNLYCMDKKPLDAPAKTWYSTNVANNKAEYPLSPQRGGQRFTSIKSDSG